MSTMKKRIPMFLLALAMMVAMAVPAFALPTSGENNHFYAWSGTVVGGSKVALTEMGTGQRLKARTYTGLSSQKWRVMQKTEGGYVIENENGDCVNIYRVAQSTSTKYSYYYATGYPYESATGGRDQRVWYETFNRRSCIRLMNPLAPSNLSVTGKWYLVTDATNPSTQTDLIWFGDPSALKAGWAS